ncbi:polysaccharide deacetylase family protein [candidate division KSB1 bacterium]|nr:polysaccharide deacetylase family protein [candidate division KSB1 bacterium]
MIANCLSGGRKLDADNAIPILAYHKVDTRLEWGLTRVSPGQFRRQIKYLSDAGYRTCSLETCLASDQPTPQGKSVVITFDDAYESIFTYAFPILREFNFTATIFVITGFVGTLNHWDINLGGIKFKHLEWNQLSELAEAGWELGSHSVSHPDLRNCSDAELTAELTQSRQRIEDEIQSPVTCFSYPFNRYDQRVIRAVQAAGYRCACTLDYNFFSPKSKHYLIGRKSIYGWDSVRCLRRKLKRDPVIPFEAMKQKAVTTCARASVLIKNFEKAIASDSRTRACEAESDENQPIQAR